jgi:outer membrane lipoprotein-sorting protein
MQCWPEPERTRPKRKGGGVLIRIGACLLFTLSLSACSFFTTRADEPLRQATLQELTTLLAERQAAIHSMKGMFSAKLTGGILPIGQRVEGTVFYQRPDAIRLRGFTAFGGELF